MDQGRQVRCVVTSGLEVGSPGGEAEDAAIVNQETGGGLTVGELFGGEEDGEAEHLITSLSHSSSSSLSSCLSLIFQSSSSLPSSSSSPPSSSSWVVSLSSQCIP